MASLSAHGRDAIEVLIKMHTSHVPSGVWISNDIHYIRQKYKCDILPLLDHLMHLLNYQHSYGSQFLSILYLLERWGLIEYDSGNQRFKLIPLNQLPKDALKPEEKARIYGSVF